MIKYVDDIARVIMFLIWEKINANQKLKFKTPVDKTKKNLNYTKSIDIGLSGEG